MVIWIVGLSGAGKTTLANLLKEQLIKSNNKLIKSNNKIVIVDGDEVRAHFNNDLGHSLKDRKKNAQRIINFCKLLEKQEITVIVPILHNFVDQRERNRKEFKNYLEIYIEAQKKTLFKRDHKNLYSNFRKKKIKNVVGLDLKFNPPIGPDITLKSENSRTSNLNKVLKIISSKSYYFYDDNNYRNNKFIYAYCNVSDENFLRGYFLKRENIIRNFLYKKHLKKREKYKTDIKYSKQKIEDFCLRFEKNRNIKNQSGEEIKINEYVQISLLFSKYLRKNRSLRILNCYLKLNDYIIYRLKKIDNSFLKSLFTVSLEYELKLIKKKSHDLKVKI